MSIPPLANTGGAGDTRLFDLTGGMKRHITQKAEINALSIIATQLDPAHREDAINDHIAVLGGLASIPNRVDAVTVEQVEAIVKRVSAGGSTPIDYEAIADAVNDEAARRLKS